MKRRWPNRVIVADLKTMDACRFEMESRLKPVLASPEC